MGGERKEGGGGGMGTRQPATTKASQTHDSAKREEQDTADWGFIHSPTRDTRLMKQFVSERRVWPRL